MEKCFLEKGVYLNPSYKGGVFVCESIKGIGKLVLYNKEGNYYHRTNIQYFLNTFKEDDFKELILDIENYELLGYIDSNYKIKDKILTKEV